MGNFFKISGVIVSSLFAMFVFIFCIRMKTSSEPFISTKSIAIQFSTYDYWEPWYSFMDFAEDYKEDAMVDVGSSALLFQDVHWNEPTYTKVNNPLDIGKNIGTWFSALFDIIRQFFNAFGNLMYSLGVTIGKTFELVIRFIISLLHWIGYVVWSMFDFLKYILTA